MQPVAAPHTSTLTVGGGEPRQDQKGSTVGPRPGQARMGGSTKMPVPKSARRRHQRVHGWLLVSLCSRRLQPVTPYFLCEPCLTEAFHGAGQVL